MRGGGEKEKGWEGRTVHSLPHGVFLDSLQLRGGLALRAISQFRDKQSLVTDLFAFSLSLSLSLSLALPLPLPLS